MGRKLVMKMMSRYHNEYITAGLVYHNKWIVFHLGIGLLYMLGEEPVGTSTPWVVLISDVKTLEVFNMGQKWTDAIPCINFVNCRSKGLFSNT